MTLDVVRERLLRSKRDELTYTVSSRKRKLRELYAVARSTEPVPQHLGLNNHDAPFDEGESVFLDQNDITKGRVFDESTLPAKQHFVLSVQSRIPDGRNSREEEEGRRGKGDAEERESETRSGIQSANANGVRRRSISPRKGAVQGAVQSKLDLDRLRGNGESPLSTDRVMRGGSRDRKTSLDVSGKQQSIAQYFGSGRESPTKQSRPSLSPTKRTPSLKVDRMSPPPQDTETVPQHHPSSASHLTTTHETPPSPDSTVGPYSATTVGVNGASTDTSPDQEVDDHRRREMQEVARPPVQPASKPPDIDTSARSPSTADAQLRFEDERARNDSDQAEEAPGSGRATVSPRRRESVVPRLSESRERDTPPTSKPQTPSAPQHSERMTTRVSSGAMRHKSVSEILGEKPRSTSSPHSEESPGLPQVARPSTPAASPGVETQSPRDLNALVKREEQKTRDRPKPSTIVFSRPGEDSSLTTRPELREHGLESLEERDYLLPLFVTQASSQPRAPAIGSLLATARKTLTTSNHYVEIHENQDCRILKRIYQLQYANRWSLRQLERAVEPPRPTSHWDMLLEQMRWMRTDFREEKKWKVAASKSLADWCCAWVTAEPDERKKLQVHIRRRQTKTVEKDVEMRDADNTEAKTPELVPSCEDDLGSEALDERDTPVDIRDAVPPAKIFSLGADDMAFAMDDTPVGERLLSELPLYKFPDEPTAAADGHHRSSDATWMSSMVPVSKFVQGKISPRTREMPSRPSRYDFEAEPPYNDDEQILRLSREGATSIPASALRPSRYELAPEENDVALFNPENKHLKDRLHAGHAFRPPYEFPMPSQAFFENRQSSQWTVGEDSELRSMVREYSFNWSLISSLLQSKSQYSPGAERRTPWECFERWISLDTIPTDMQKIHYFRAYYSRIEAAQRNLVQSQAQQALAGSSVMPNRKRTAQPVRVERRKNTRHLALFDAMRKLAKKRENTAQKREHDAQITAARRANNPDRHRELQHFSPQQLTQLKQDREKRMHERAELYRQNIQHRSLLMRQHAQQAQQVQHQQQQQQPQQQIGLPNGNVPHARGAGPPGTPQMGSALPNGAGTPVQSKLAVPHPSYPTDMGPGAGAGGGGTPNVDGTPGLGNTNVNGNVNVNGPMSMKSVPQAQMQAALNQRHPGAMTHEMRLFMENQRLFQEQRRFQRQQQQQAQQGQGQGQGGQQQQGTPQMGGQSVQGGSSPPNMGFIPAAPMGGMNMPQNMQQSIPNMQNNPALMAALQANAAAAAANNHARPSSAASSSPPMGGAGGGQRSQPQQLSSGVIPTINSISHQIKSQNPNASPEQISRMASEQLTHYQQRMTQAAMNAAAGTPHHAQGTGGGGGGQMGVANGMSNPQIYAQMLRTQQQNQSRTGQGPAAPPGGSPGMAASGVRPPSRSATNTPHHLQHQRSGSVQTPNPSQGPNTQSPRPPQAQMVNNS